jgi:transcriptional regulator with XRE-family HTH domain
MTDIRQVLAKNIKLYRKIRGFSQEMLAEKAGSSTTHIGMIEIGKKFPSPQMLARIAEALGIDTPELFTSQTVQMVAPNSKSIERLRQDILEDCEILKKTISARIKELRQ